MARAKYRQFPTSGFLGGLRVGIPDRMYDLGETPQCMNVEFYPPGAVTKRQGSQRIHTYPVGTHYVSGSSAIPFSADPASAASSIAASSSVPQPIIKISQQFIENTDYMFAFTAGSSTTLSAGSSSYIPGSVYLWNGIASGWNPCNSGLTSAGYTWDPDINTPICIENFAGSLFATNSINDPTRWNPALDSWEFFTVSGGVDYTSNYSTSGMISCKVVKAFKNFLFIGNTIEGGDNHSSRIRWSLIGNMRAWPTDYWIDLDPEDGLEITAMEVVGDYLAVFKKRKTYIIAYVGGQLIFKPTLVINKKGCIGPNAITQIGNELLFLGEDGFYVFNGSNWKPVSDKIKDRIILDIDPRHRQSVQMQIDEYKDKIWTIIPSGTPSFSMESPRKQNNAAFSFDYKINNWAPNTMNYGALGTYYRRTDYTWDDLEDQAPEGSAIWGPNTVYYWDELRWDDQIVYDTTPQILAGTYGGFVVEFDQTTSDEVSGSISSQYRTPWLDMKVPARTKRIMRVNLQLRCEGSGATHNLTYKIRTNWDDNATPILTGAIPLSGSNQHYTGPIASGETMEYRLDLTAQGRAFQIEFLNDGADEPWRLYEMNIEYLIKGASMVTDRSV